MPVRVGIDLVAVDTVQAAVDEHGERYLRRVYTPRELQACGTAAGPDASRLAGCFAAKEAAVKALRAPAGAALPWTELEVRRAADRSWAMELSGTAARLAAEAGLRDLSLSLTKAPGFAMAVVVARFPA